jgi:ribonuclease III
MTLEASLGHTFSDPALLRLALTHRSISSEDPGRNDNERLEFLGDAVLQLVITGHLFSAYPHLAEGQMAKVRAALVSKPTLAEVAHELDLGRFVELASGEERTGGRTKASILANAVEAILGAVYLDGGLEAASDVILGLWTDRVSERAMWPGVKDYKTRLQEELARLGRRPIYEVEGSGPDHDRRFVARAVIDGAVAGTGEGRSKRDAEQMAARVALETLSQS